MDELDDLIVDDTGIRIVDSTMSANQELGDVLLGVISRQHLAELRIRIDDVGDTLCRIEAGDLHDVLAGRPLQLMHLVLVAQVAELAHVELSIPVVELLVETVEP